MDDYDGGDDGKKIIDTAGDRKRGTERKAMNKMTKKRMDTI